MQGRYKLELRNSGRLTDADFQRAIKEGRLDDLLAELPLELKLAGHNMINHWFTACFYHNVFGHGFSDSPYPTYNTHNPFVTVCLMTTDSEPTFTETYNWYGNPHTPSGSANTGSGAKGFITSDTEDPVIEKAADGREEIKFRERWLWLPSQGVSNNIRSLGIFGAEYLNYWDTYQRWKSGRIRFKDPDTGAPVVINKNLNQVLVLEYTVFFVSV